MSFEKLEIDGDILIEWENEAMRSFVRCFGSYEGNKARINELIEMCKKEEQKPSSWLTAFAAKTALGELRVALEECE